MRGGDVQSSTRPHTGIHVVIAELAFLLMPFLVIGFSYLFRGDVHNAIYSPYWSIASSLLIAQALIRFIIRLVHSNSRDPEISWERVTVIFSVLIVFGLIPSLLVLLLVLISAQPSFYLGVTQLVLFVFGFLLYLALCSTGYEMVSTAPSSEEFSVDLDVTTANIPRAFKKASGE